MTTTNPIAPIAADDFIAQRISGQVTPFMESWNRARLNQSQHAKNVAREIR